LITVEKDKNSDHDLVELKAKFESLEEAINCCLKEIESKSGDQMQEHQLDTNTTINCFESYATDIDDSNIKIQENQNETHNRLRNRQENHNTTHNRLQQLETQHQVSQTANQNFEHQIRERQAETEYERNIERKYHELRIAIDNLERNQRADRIQLTKLNLTMLEFKATITEHETIHKQLGQNCHSLATYIDENVAAVREESRTLIDERIVAVREESRTYIDENVAAVREESRTLIDENVAAVRTESRTLIDENVAAVRAESRTYIEAINRQYNDQRTVIQEHSPQIRETGKLHN